MKPAINRDQLVFGRVAMNMLGGVSAGVILLQLVNEWMRRKQWEERNRRWGR